MDSLACHRILRALIILVAYILSPATVAAPKDPGQISMIAEGVYAHIVSPNSVAVSNSGFVILQDSVLVFDTHFTPEAGQMLLAEIKKVTSKPVRYVVNSHFHPDHTHGNQVFTNAQQMFASAQARRDILQKDIPAMKLSLRLAQDQIEKMRREMVKVIDAPELANIRRQILQRQEFLDRMSRLKIVPPLMTLDDNLEIAEGSKTLQLLYLGKGHTDGDIVLYLPKERISFVGDLFFNRALPNTQDASLLDWMKTLDEVLKLDADTFVPGHGSAGSKEQVRAFLKYLEDLRALVEPAVSRGDTLQQVLLQVQIPEKYAAYDFQDFFRSNLQKMYVEFKALQPPTPPQKPN